MNAKQARRCRAKAHSVAVHSDLWKQCAELIDERDHWRLKKRLPWKRREYTDLVGWLYKRNLKEWSRNVFAALHDEELKAFERTRARLQRKWAAERAKRKEFSVKEEML